MVANEERDFDWRVYADATCAGLTALIPIPFVDLAFEATFRRRIPGMIARVNGRSLRPEVRTRLARRERRLLSGAGCVALPLAVARYLARVVWRKVVYVLALADAARLVSAYWHRAYLMDHMIRAGHLEQGADAGWALQVFDTVLREADTSPLIGLARQVVSTSRRILGLLLRAFRHGTAGVTDALGEILSSHWDAAEQSLREVALRYNELYVQRPSPPDRAAAPPAGLVGAGSEGGPLDDPQPVG